MDLLLWKIGGTQGTFLPIAKLLGFWATTSHKIFET